MNNCHITYTRTKITESYLELYKDDIEMCRPTCEKCGKELKLGDYIDSYFPHFVEYNLCKECESGLDDSKRID